jgi:Protein of unknown function (DUF1579)
MKQRAALLLAVMVCAVMAIAQNPPAPPNPGPEVKKLGYFAGTWKLEGDMKPGPMGPGGKFTETDHMQWMDGGFFLVSHAEAKLPTGPGKSMAIFGYDANEKAYTYQEYNSMGETIHARGAVAGDTWTWTNEEKMEGKMMKGRYTVKVTSPTSYNFKFEMQPEGGAWGTVMEGTATKQTGPAPAKK